MIDSDPLPVLIIGAGLGGLTLANSLQKYGIPYHIFERDSEASQRAQGYRVSIDGGAGGAGLKAALTHELFEEFKKSCGESVPVGGRVEGRSGRILARGLWAYISAGGWATVLALAWRLTWKRWERMRAVGFAAWLWSWSESTCCEADLVYAPQRPLALQLHDAEYKIDRRITRAVLLTGQSQYITYGAAFEKYTITSGGVTAHFADGSSAAGSLIVGSDGIRSKVASQLLGANARAPLDLGARVVYGKTPITPELEAAMHPFLRRGCNFVTDVQGDKMMLVIEPMRFDHPLSQGDYVFWALASTPSVFYKAMGDEDDAKLLSSQGQAARDIAMGITAPWDPRIRIVFEQQDPTQSATLKLTSSDPRGAPIWDTDSRVTVLGDAIHCMPPTGGQGANTAMRDGAVLGKALGESWEWLHREKFSGWMRETIRLYEDEMRYQIGDIVGLACVAAEGMVGAKLPESWGKF